VLLSKSVSMIKDLLWWRVLRWR